MHTYIRLCVTVVGERDEGREVYKIFVTELWHQFSYKRKRGCENSSFGWAGYPGFSFKFRIFMFSQLSPVTVQTQYLNRVSIWIYVWICSCIVLSPPFSNKEAWRNIWFRRLESAFLRATSGMVKHISCSDCARGYNLDIQYFLSVFFL